ncbi:MAG TPA: hypothetical protein VH120_13825 [Gemmataceae bacterium]|jgi:hypothetical protein|nr:hypothetical protein [Gemmataceae bacterium]
MFATCGAEKDGWASLGLSVGFGRQEDLQNNWRLLPKPGASRQGWVSLGLQPNMDWPEVTAIVTKAFPQGETTPALKEFNIHYDDERG